MVVPPALAARRKILCKRFSTKSRISRFNVHDGGLFPLVISLPAGWNGMRTACGVNAVPACREYYFKGISLPCGRRTWSPAGWGPCPNSDTERASASQSVGMPDTASAVANRHLWTTACSWWSAGTAGSDLRWCSSCIWFSESPEDIQRRYSKLPSCPPSS